MIADLNSFNNRNILTVLIIIMLTCFSCPDNCIAQNSGERQILSTNMVEVGLFIPGIIIDMRYANNNNVFGQKIYDENTAYLRMGTVNKLIKIQDELQKQGYSLKIWDAYRPPEAQFKLWKICPDNRYVANPYNSFSNHSRGCTVDVTLVDMQGMEVEMPSDFDDFSAKANRDYSDVSNNAAANARLLENIMKKYGFTTIESEWWHFDDSEKNKYQVIHDLSSLLNIDIFDNSNIFEDWRPGNFQPVWLANNPECRSLINKAIDQGLISGYNYNDKSYIGLDFSMTRAEFAAMLTHVLNIEIDKNSSAEWYFPYISALNNTGVIDKYNWTNKEWNQYITRPEMARWIGKSLLINNYPFEPHIINDVNNLEIEAAVLSGIFNGDNKGNFNWQDNAKRVQGIIVLMKLQEKLNLSPPEFIDDRIVSLRTITISAIGDCVIGTDSRFPQAGRFDTELRAQGYNYNYFFKNVKSILENDDLTIANLETTLTTANKKPDKSHQEAAFFFKGAPSHTKILQYGSIEAVNFANNHSYDYLEQGYQDTINNLDNAGIQSFGYDRKAFVNIKGINVGLLGYNALGALEEGLNIESLCQQIATDLEFMKQSCELLVVSMHWGIEGSELVSDEQITLGRFAINNGADLVLGHHPHVIQKIEKYNNKYIVYSLGNFCYGGNNNPNDKSTFILQQDFTFNQDNNCINDSHIRVFPCSVSSVKHLNNYCPTPVEGEAARLIMQRVGI